MPALKHVRDFVIANWPHPVCNDCITYKLELPANEHVDHRTIELSELSGFVRERRGCIICCQIKEVIRYL
jgi:hypothetical protein